MLIFLLIIIAIGVLLCSEEGKEMLTALFGLVIFGGLGLLALAIIVILLAYLGVF